MRKVAKKGIHTTKQTREIKNKKRKMKKEFEKFIVDQQGESKPARFPKADETRPGNTLGRDPLIEKERELVLDLFGDDLECQEKMEALAEEEEDDEELPEVTVKVEAGEKGQSPFIPDDPHDIHQRDEEKEKKPAWVDEDDHNIRVRDVVAGMDKARGSRGVREESEEQYSLTLQQKFNQTVGGTPQWARLQQPDAEQDVEDGGLVEGTGDYLAHGRSVKLRKKWINFKRELDLNHTSRTEGAIISASEFNPKHSVALVAGFSRSVLGAASLFKVNGISNDLIHSVKFPKFPIKYAKFLCDGGRFVAGSSQYNHFYMYDLEAAQETKIPSTLGRDGHNMKDVVVSPDGELLVFIGNNGHLHLFDADCLSLVATLYAPEDVTSAAFNATGSRLFTHSSEGNVRIWDMNARVCLHHFYDDGCVNGTSIAVSPSNQYLACGSASGVVNVYDMPSVMSPSPTPVKMLGRLRTSVSALAFNCSSEILASASDRCENAIKFVHLPSMTYFQNFPRPSSELRKIHVINFSPGSGYLAAGNDGGRAYLYRLLHYTRY